MLRILKNYIDKRIDERLQSKEYQDLLREEIGNNFVKRRENENEEYIKEFVESINRQRKDL